MSDITVFDKKDIEQLMETMSKCEYKFIKCSWCEESYYVREVGANYICPDCEKKERAAGRPLIFTSPVRDTYFFIS